MVRVALLLSCLLLTACGDAQAEIPEPTRTPSPTEIERERQLSARATVEARPSYTPWPTLTPTVVPSSVNFSALSTPASRVPYVTEGEAAAARAGCRHFNNILNDAKDGVLTDSEFRMKMKEVERDLSTIPRAREAAREILATVTQRRSTLLQDVERLAGICLEYVR